MKIQKYLFPIVLALSIFSLAFQKSKHGTIILWGAGFMHPDEVVGKTGQTWFGLFETNDGFYLKKTTVTIKDSSNGLHDSYVDVDGTGTVLFLVRGNEKFVEGPVQTCFSGRQLIEPNQEIRLKLGDELTYNFIGAGKKQGESIENYSLALYHNQMKQRILAFESIGIEQAYYPEMLWVGDLDRDSKPDLLIDLGGFNSSEVALFLSTAAGKGEFLKQVAVFERIGC